MREIHLGSIKLKTSPEVTGSWFCNLTTLIEHCKLDGENGAAAITFVYRRGAVRSLAHFSSRYLQILMSLVPY